MFRMRSFFLFTFLLAMASLACQISLPLASTSTPAAQSGDTLFYDGFSNPATGWERFTSAEGTMDYDGSGYRFLVNALQANFWSTPGKSFKDVRLEVDVAKLSGPDENRIGLLCRFVEGNYYFFMVSSDGYYTIGKYIGGNAIQLGQSEMQYNESIHTGLAVNHLRADCVGNSLTFYVNGNPVAQTQDADFPAGDVGLLAGTFSQPGVDVIFDNFVVLQP
ncbi:MAG: hypothetical protein JW963_02630 [Anaerolineales bacterium]|nr:hypothetical protein [Anaerolineales bacterium]